MKETEEKITAGTQSSSIVIGIGASAGGLEALQQFFSYMPPNSGLSFVVVQHLSIFWASTLRCPSVRRKTAWPWSRTPST